MPDSGNGLVTLSTYSRTCCSVSVASGVATGLLWSLGTPHRGSSGGTGGAIIGTQYRFATLVRMTSKTLDLYVGFVTIWCNFGIPLRRGEMFKLFLSPPITSAAVGYFESRYKLVLNRWSSRRGFLRDFGGE